MIFVILMLVVFPFVLGFFQRGPEWLMYPGMYWGRYLLWVSSFGVNVRWYLKSKK